MLSLSKSILNGIGSASGVAWPSFGIVCALLGASIGGPISLGLAISSVFLFFTVGTPIIYFSYQDSQNQQRQLLKQNLYHQQRLFESINHYLQRIKEHHLKEKSSFTYPQYLQIIINKDLNLLAIKESKSPLYRLLVILKDHTQDDILNRRIIFESINSTYPRHPIAKSQLLIPAFYGFVGTFGSIAGFSAGFSGLLSGIGVFAGFAAFPLLGWGVLGAALLIGGYVGIKTAQNTALEYQKKQSTNLMKHMHQQLTQTTIERTISAQLYQITDSLTKTPAEKKKLYKLISQPLYSSLNSLSSHPLHLNSFFKPSSNHSFNRVVTNDYGMVANQTCR